MLATTAEIYRYVLFGVNKGNAGTVTPDEFDILYNGAAVDFVMQRARAAERDQRMLDDLRALVPDPVVIPNTGTMTSEGEVFVLPFTPTPPPAGSHGYMHMLSAAFKVVDHGGSAACSPSGGWSVGRILRRDQRYGIKRDPFKRPSPLIPRYWLSENKAMVYCGAGNHATEMKAEFLRYPRAVSVLGAVDPDLPPAVNQQIADYAVRRYLENIESPRYNTFLQERRVNN